MTRMSALNAARQYKFNNIGNLGLNPVQVVKNVTETFATNARGGTRTAEEQLEAAEYFAEEYQRRYDRRIRAQQYLRRKRTVSMVGKLKVGAIGSYAGHMLGNMGETSGDENVSEVLGGIGSTVSSAGAGFMLGGPSGAMLGGVIAAAAELARHFQRLSLAAA